MLVLSDDISYWLAAIHLEGIGPVRIRRWLEQFETLKNVFAATSSDLQSAGLTPRQIHAVKNPRWPLVEKDLAWCEKAKCHVVAYDDARYPFLLREIPDAPLILFVQGDVEVLSKPQLAIVGTRNPTKMGSELAEQFAYYLAKAGLVITSGLALGIDAASHRGALNAEGKTIAVFGTGFKHIYPSSNRRLASEIIEKGALITEFPPDTPPKAKYFPLRNRIISGLSLGVLVIEAAVRSGSLITTRYAIEQGREVFALPGSIHNPLARGCHQLIRQGAKLVETADDIMEELGSLKAAALQTMRQPLDLDPLQQQILAQIGYEITPLDAIIMRSGLTASEVSSMLLSLELDGYVAAVPGGYVRNAK